MNPDFPRLFVQMCIRDSVYILRNKMLENTRPNLRILHPLPRVNEIAYDVDDNPKA